MKHFCLKDIVYIREVWFVASAGYSYVYNVTMRTNEGRLKLVSSS